MQSTQFDAVIVGGGPAGSTAGAYLAQGGLRVLIVEKERFPRFHIGESLLPAGNSILREIGAWEKIEAAGFQRKYGAEFLVGNGSALPKRVEFAQGLLPGLEYTYQVERSRFDELLLRHAGAAGCEVREETRATGAQELGADGYEVTLQSAGGTASTIRCSWVLDASGRDTLFAKPLKLNKTEPILAKRIAIYAHFRGVQRAEGKAAGNIVIVRHGEGWFWMIPLDARRTSIGLVTTSTRMKAARLKPAELFEQIVGESPRLARLMDGAEAMTDFHVTGDYSYRARTFADRRLLLVGDAAGFLDPMFSTGVYVALFSARLAAREVLAAHRRGRALSAWAQRRYTRRLGANLALFEQLVLAFYDNDSFSVFMDRMPPLGLARAINSIVAGNSEPPWRVRWRYWVFLLVCRLQKRWQLVKRINLAAPQETAEATAKEPASAVAA